MGQQISMFDTFTKLDTAVENYFKQLDTFHKGLKYASYIYEYSCEQLNLRKVEEVSLAEAKMFDSIKALGTLLYKERDNSDALKRINEDKPDWFHSDVRLIEGLAQMVRKTHNDGSRLASGSKKLQISKPVKEAIESAMTPLDNAASILEVLLLFGTK